MEKVASDIRVRYSEIMPVARAYCCYLAPISYGDAVVIATWIAEVKKVQLTFRYQLVRQSDGVPFAEGFTAHGCIDASGRPMRVPHGISLLGG
ncbi:MAG TPA: thioesterase family protein [Planctomycetota bacterium]|nr:thioesterase family protein [Planctomycetota bacterium]